MELEEALYNLGVKMNTLSLSQKKKLDSDGFLCFPGILSDQEINKMRDVTDRVYLKENTGKESGAVESSYMQNKTAGLDVCFTHPNILAAIAYVLDGQIKSFGIHGRPHPAGGEQQALHVDYNGPPAQGGKYAVCNSIWMLSDFTKNNGATRVIPGSHLSGKNPQDALEDLVATHPDEKLLLGKAGSVVVFNSHVWHGTTENRSQQTRASLTSFFCRRDDPHMVFSSALSDAARKRLKESAQSLFVDPELWKE